MKKLLSMGLLTLCALAVSEREAQAWVNAKFSIGLNWHVQSANNNVLWGLWKNGQVPGPEAFGQPGGGGGGYFGPSQGAPYMPPTNGGNFPYFGGVPAGYPAPLPQGFPTQTNPPPMNVQQQAFGNYYNPYQTVSYQQGNYYVPSYYYPSYYSGYGYQAPSYWYQGR